MVEESEEADLSKNCGTSGRRKFSVEDQLIYQAQMRSKAEQAMHELDRSRLEIENFDHSKFADCRRKIRIRSHVAEELIEQLYQQKLTWLATPLPLRIRLKLRIKRFGKKISNIIMAFRQLNNAD